MPSPQSPRTLVALVDISPTPALLSALTFAPARLVLLHGSAARDRAERVAALARRRCPGLNSCELFDLGGDVDDFTAVAHRIDALLPRLTEPWRLCYTGGTKVMSVLTALRHTDRFPDRHDWRCYLDATSDTLWFTDGSTHPGGVDSTALRTADLAELHDAPLTPSPRLAAQEAWLRGQPVDLDSGEVFEAEVLRWFRERLARVPDAEVVGNQRITDPYDPDRTVGDFDLVVRYRHRVLCVEAKTRSHHVPDTSGWTLAKARRVFGGAARVLFVHRDPAGRDTADLLAGYDPGLSGRSVHVRHWVHLRRRLTTGRRLVEEFFSTAPPQVRAAAAPCPPVRAEPAAAHPEPSTPLLLTGLGGSSIAAMRAAHAHRPDRMVLLFSRQSEKEQARLGAALGRVLFAAEHPDAYRALPRRHLAGRLRRDGYPARTRFAGQAVGAADVPGTALLADARIRRYRRERAPVVADITTGTKAMAVGLALTARAHGGCVTYQAPLARRFSCHVHGSVAVPGPAEVDWSLALSGYARLTTTLAEAVAAPVAARQVDVALLDAAVHTLRDLVGGRAATVLVDRTVLTGAPEHSQYSARQRPTLVLAVADRALGLCAPSWTPLRYVADRTADQPQSSSAGEWAHDVFAAAELLKVRCGTAALPLVLHRPGDSERTRRARELVDWYAWRRPDAPSGPGNAVSPRMVGAQPADAAFRSALADGLAGLGVVGARS